ncbi:MAG: arginase, partial [Bdellovibrionales bacterium]|nr:arginase [Bdellovibrionales bacterium]
SIGSISAISSFYRAQGKKIGVIWIDTHSDIHTPTTSISKNIHGMSIAFLAGLAPGAFASLSGDQAAVSLDSLAYIGLRDVDSAEKEVIKKQSISAFTAHNIDRWGMGQVVEEAIKIASKDTAGFVVSFDLDVCDPNIAPATGTPMRGGLTYRESHLALEMLHESGRMLGFELVEYNPDLEDERCQTGELAISLVESALGARIL